MFMGMLFNVRDIPPVAKIRSVTYCGWGWYNNDLIITAAPACAVPSGWLIG